MSQKKSSSKSSAVTKEHTPAPSQREKLLADCLRQFTFPSINLNSASGFRQGSVNVNIPYAAIARARNLMKD